jgi:hypothetical protein
VFAIRRHAIVSLIVMKGAIPGDQPIKAAPSSHARAALIAAEAQGGHSSLRVSLPTFIACSTCDVAIVRFNGPSACAMAAPPIPALNVTSP